MIPSELNNASMNEAANYYRCGWGINYVPANTRNKKTYEKWKILQDTPLLEEQHNQWNTEGACDNGIALVMGKFWNNPLMDAKFLNCVDLDNKAAIDAFCYRNGRMYSLEELAQSFPIEQHADNPGRCHIYVVTNVRPLKNKGPNEHNKEDIPAIEVHGKGLIYCTPSVHEGGYKYQFVYGLKGIEEYEAFDPEKIEEFINNICTKHGIPYLDKNSSINGNNNGNNNNKTIGVNEIWYEGERNDKLHEDVCRIIRKNYNVISEENIRKLIHIENQSHCIPPLPDNEVEQIFHSAWKFISEQMANEGDKKENEGKTKILIAFETVRQQARNLFIDEYKIPHIAIPIQDHLEVLPVNSSAFKNWYRMFIFERDGIVLENQTINDLCSLASAYAASPKYGTQIKLNLRTALNINFGKPEWIYDLVNKDWEFIKITSKGWNVVKDEIIFRRYSNQQPQVYPDRNYQPDIFNEFFKLVNIKVDDKDSILLLKCYIITLFIPEIQKVVLMLHGSQGAAKSSLQELIKMLVDPSIVKTFTFPRDLNELIQQLSHNHITYYDNISIIKPWISDQLCRAVTGSGSSKRQLYTDDDDIIRSFKRCIGLNGINIAATKADLLDRSIIIKLERILDGKHRTPEDIWKAFDGIKAQLFGYILDVLVKVLDYEEQNPDEQFKLTRMTEFAKYGEIISRCMGNPEKAFIDAYERNRQIQTEEIIEFSQVATVITYMMFEKYFYLKEWDGTASELLGEFKAIINTDENRDIPKLNIDIKNEYWPKNGNALRRRLNELIPTLKQIGLEIIFYKVSDRNKTRRITIRKVASDASDASEGKNLRSNMDDFSDATADANTNGSDGSETIASDDIDKNRVQNEVSDATDATDVNVRGSIGDVSQFIKLEGYQRGDKISYFLDSAVADFSIQNGFLGGRISMRGEGGGRYPTNFIKIIDEIFGPEPNTIEVCGNEIQGRNKGGSCFTVDISPEFNPDLVADGQDLKEIADNTFSRYRCDPPYNEKTAKEMYGCKLPNVTKLLKEGCRVVKPGSLLFLLHEYITPSNIQGLKKIGFIHITAVPNTGPRVLNIYVKLPN